MVLLAAKCLRFPPTFLHHCIRQRFFYTKTAKNFTISVTLGDLGVTFALLLRLVRNSLLDFLFVIIEFFFDSYTVDTL